MLSGSLRGLGRLSFGQELLVFVNRDTSLTLLVLLETLEVGAK